MKERVRGTKFIERCLPSVGSSVIFEESSRFDRVRNPTGGNSRCSQ